MPHMGAEFEWVCGLGVCYKGKFGTVFCLYQDQTIYKVRQDGPLLGELNLIWKLTTIRQWGKSWENYPPATHWTWQLSDPETCGKIWVTCRQLSNYKLKTMTKNSNLYVNFLSAYALLICMLSYKSGSLGLNSCLGSWGAAHLAVHSFWGASY